MAGQDKPSNTLPLVLALAGVGVCLILCLPAGAVGLYFAFRADPPNQGPRNDGQVKEQPQVKITRESLKKIESGMSLDEVNQAIGPGKLSTEDEMRRAFGEDAGIDLGASGKWIHIGQNAGVTSWHQWQNSDESIFIGFAKGRRTAKDRVITCFWVKRKDAGFQTDIGILALFPVDDPDSLADERDQRNKLLNDPAFKQGDAKKLIVGVWLDETKCGYEFRADGTVTNLGIGGWNGTYRFVAADRIDITFPVGQAMLPGVQPTVNSYRILVSQDTLIMKTLPDEALLFTHKRVR